MQEAILEAQKAADIGEVPVGAVIVKDDKIIGRGHNMTETGKDPTRIKKVIIGTDDPKTGACGSVLNLLQENGLNHQVEIERGIMAEECGEMMTAFFRRLRKSKSEEDIR